MATQSELFEGEDEGDEGDEGEPAAPEVPDELVLPGCVFLTDEKADEIAAQWRLPAYWLLHVDGELVREKGNGAVRLAYEVEIDEFKRYLPADGKLHQVQVELRACNIASGRPGLRVVTVDLGAIPGRPPQEVMVVPPTGLEPGSQPFGAGPQTHFWQAHTVPPPDAFMALVHFSRDTQRAAFEAVAAQHKAYAGLAEAERNHNREMFMGMVKHWNQAANRQNETLDTLASRLTEALAGLRPGQSRDEAAPAAPANDNPLMALAQQGPALLKQISDFLPEEMRGEIIAGLVDKFTGGGKGKSEMMSMFADASRALVTKWTGVDITTPFEEEGGE